MPANGVIGITAQILESVELGGKEKPTPDMSMLQRIAMSFNNMRKDWKKMVGGKATGLFWVMLANSKIIQTVIGTTLKLVVTLVDILFGYILLPVVKWIIEHLAKFIRLVQNIIETIGEEFNKVFGPVWEWIKEVAMSTFPGIVSLLGIGGSKEDGDKMIDDFYDKHVIGAQLTSVEMQGWAAQPEGGLIEGGQIPESKWDPVDYVPPENLNHSTAQTSTDDIAWVYEDGPEQPEGGKLDSTMVDQMIQDKELSIIDEKYSDAELEESQNSFWSWTDDIEQFGWNDIVGWFSGAETDFTAENIMRELFGRGAKESSESDSRKAVKTLIDESIEGESKDYATAVGSRPPIKGSKTWSFGSTRWHVGTARFYPPGHPIFDDPNYWVDPK
jgi:hypothetical protein